MRELLAIVLNACTDELQLNWRIYKGDILDPVFAITVDAIHESHLYSVRLD